MHDQNFFPFFGMSHGLGWVFMILFWVVVIAGIVAVVRWLTAGTSRRGQDKSPSTDKTPADMLRDRYARSEIDREEFFQRLEDLNDR